MDDKIEDAWRQLLRDIDSYTCGETPSTTQMARAPKLAEWEAKVRRRGKESILVVSGIVLRTPGHEDGEWVTTSAVVWFDRKMRFARTQTRLYTLGQPAGGEIPIDGIDT